MLRIEGARFHHPLAYGSVGPHLPGESVPNDVLFPIRIVDFEAQLHVAGGSATPSVGDIREIAGRRLRITHANDLDHHMFKQPPAGSTESRAVYIHGEPVSSEERAAEAKARGRLEEYASFMDRYSRELQQDRRRRGWLP